MTMWISLFVALVGALVYGFANGKAANLGLAAFLAGMIAFLEAVGSGRVHF